MTRALTLLALLALTLTLTACATIDGAGQDLQAAGTAVSNAAKEAKAGM